MGKTDFLKYVGAFRVFLTKFILLVETFSHTIQRESEVLLQCYKPHSCWHTRHAFRIACSWSITQGLDQGFKVGTSWNDNMLVLYLTGHSYNGTQWSPEYTCTMRISGTFWRQMHSPLHPNTLSLLWFICISTSKVEYIMTSLDTLLKSCFFTPI